MNKGIALTGITLGLTITMGLSLASSNTTISGFSAGNFTGTVATSKDFADQEVTSSVCNITDDEVQINFVDDKGTTAGSLTGVATVDGCETTVSGTQTATLTETPEA